MRYALAVLALCAFALGCNETTLDADTAVTICNGHTRNLAGGRFQVAQQGSMSCHAEVQFKSDQDRDGPGLAGSARLDIELDVESWEGEDGTELVVQVCDTRYDCCVAVEVGEEHIGASVSVEITGMRTKWSDRHGARRELIVRAPRDYGRGVVMFNGTRLVAHPQTSTRHAVCR